jgi:cell division protein FtsZ
MSNQLGSYLAVIKVVGIGGGGTNAVTRMVEAGVTGVEFVAVNTDAQALLMTEADEKIHIGSTATRGLGAGADPRVGLAAAEETWCSSPRGKAAAPAPAVLRSSRRSAASSVRSRWAS